MDGGISIVRLEIGERLNVNDRVYRTTTINGKFIRPDGSVKETAFTMTPKDKYQLSVDCASMASVEKCLAVLGATYKPDKEEYKPWDNRKIFTLDVSFLYELDEIMKIIYSPVIVSPPCKGRETNDAHSLIVIREEIRKNWDIEEPFFTSKLADHANANPINPVPIDLKKSRTHGK